MSNRLHPVTLAVVFLAMLLIVVSACSAPASATTGTISGASLATCMPSPCVNGSDSAYTLTSVSNDNGTASDRAYEVYRPGNLTPSPTNLAPAVLAFYAAGNCGFGAANRFPTLAAANRFVVVYMEVPCGRDDNWDKKNVNSTVPVVPNDEPYVAAVVHDITQCPSAGAGPNQCVDPQRIYVAGMSSGGNMAADVMCDAQNSSLFRGYLIDSSSLELYGGSPHCPSTNRSFFVMMALSNYSIDAGLYYNTAVNPHLDVPAFADWAAGRLGCTAPRIDDAIGSPVASTLRYSYFGPCAYATAGSAAVITLGVQNGGHTWGCQDSDSATPPNPCPGMPNPPGLGPNGLPKTNGLFIEGDFWNFVAQGVSSATPAPPLDTSPPIVTISAPANGSTISGDSVSLRAGASDDVAVAGVQFQVDSANIGPEQTVGSAGTYSTTWSTTTVPDGVYSLRAVARDTAGNTSTSAVVSVRVDNSAGTIALAPRSYVALGDAYSSGDGNSPYLLGTDTRRDRCQRSLVAYPFLANASRGSLVSLGMHACAGAKIADFYHANGRNHEPRQLGWIGRGTRFISLSVGWADASFPAVMQSCVVDSEHCEARLRGRAGAAIRAMAVRSRHSQSSLYALYKQIASDAPKAKIIVVGYPRLFPAAPPPRCGTGVRRLSFTRGAMKWIDFEIQSLDGAIQRAAAAAHVSYVGASYGAFRGHNLCTRLPDLNAAISKVGAGQRHPQTILTDSFTPNRRGQLALAKRVAPLL